MKTRQKVLIAVLGAVIAGFLALTAWFSSSPYGYFCDGRCACGDDIFVRIQGDGYFRYSPGHEVPEYRAFTLRKREDGWDVFGLPESDIYVYGSSSEGKDKAVAHLRFYDGALYESWDNGTTWKRLPRALIWRVWAAKLLKK